VLVQGSALHSIGGNSVHSSGELPEAVRGFPHHAGGAFGSMAFTGMRTGSLTLSTLSRPTGHLGSGQSVGSPGAANVEFGRSGGPLQQSQSVPATPTMLLNSAAGPAASERFEEPTALRDSHSAPVLPTAPSGTSSGEQPRQGSSPSQTPSPAAGPAAGDHGADVGAEPHARKEQHPDAAQAEPYQPAGSVGVKQTHRGSAAEGSGSGGAAQQARAPGMRKNKFSSFSSDVPADRHWPPTAPSSGVSDAAMPADASPAPALRPEQQA